MPEINVPTEAIVQSSEGVTSIAFALGQITPNYSLMNAAHALVGTSFAPAAEEIASMLGKNIGTMVAEVAAFASALQGTGQGFAQNDANLTPGGN